VNFSLQSSRLPITPFVLDGYEPYDRLLAPCDDDFLAPAGFFDEPRELGFGLMDGYRFHFAMLANLLS